MNVTSDLTPCPNCDLCMCINHALWECANCGASGEATAHQPAELWIWKFLINKWTPDREIEGLTWNGCLAAAVAKTAEEAKEVIRKNCAEKGTDSRWLEVASEIRLPFEPGTMICLVME